MKNSVFNNLPQRLRALLRQLWDWLKQKSDRLLSFISGLTGAGKRSRSPGADFARIPLPRDIEEKLTAVDWSVKDVMVGTVRTAEQLEFNIESRNYYAPAKFVSPQQAQVKYIALYEEDIGNTPGIKRYGEVCSMQQVQRGKIPVTMRPRTNPGEVYYYFTVKSWHDLPCPIEIRDTSRGKPKFSNKFLLDHCRQSYQLFDICSEAEFRLMSQISNALTGRTTAVCRLEGLRALIIERDFLSVTNSRGQVVARIAVNSYVQNPRDNFYKIKKLLK